MQPLVNVEKRFSCHKCLKTFSQKGSLTNVIANANVQLYPLVIIENGFSCGKGLKTFSLKGGLTGS